MAYIQPIITPFKVFDANNAFIIELVGGINADKFMIYTSIITDYYNGEYCGQKIHNRDNIIDSVDSAEDYINNLNMTTQSTPTMIYYNYNYYLILPKNYCINGHKYQINIIFFTDENANMSIYALDHLFSCYSEPIIAFTDCVYQDGTTESIQNNKLTIKKSYSILNFSYTQNEGDNLQYYQFFLYHNGQLVGNSKKVYSSAQILYGIENYNNLQDYVLKLYCITQCGYEKWLEINIRTDYNQDNIYADLAFLFDAQKAINNVSISITQLNGTGESYTYDSETNGEYVIIPDNGFVNFIDTYQVISRNFLCRLWCRNLNINTPILTITNTDGSGHIDVYFTGQNFCAYKHSCNLVSAYISNNLNISKDELEDTNLYFALGYYNGRIEMYAQIIEQE